MNVLIFLGSPRGTRSSSFHVASHFRKGLTSAGCRTEEVLVRDCTINPCRGCFGCWLETPGRCVYRDDMDKILPKIDNADLVVYAFPLYYYSMPGIVKNLMDRQLPLVRPELVERNGRTGHPPRNPDRRNKVFLISTAGFPERSHFDSLVSTFKQNFCSEHAEFTGSILIGGAEPMHREDMQAAYADLYTLVEKAGYEVGKDGIMSKQTEREIIRRTTLSKQALEEFRKIANSYWESFTPHENRPISISGRAKRLKLSDGGIKSFLAGMAMQYKPAAVPGLEAGIQFLLDGSPYFMAIKGGECLAYSGRLENPTLTLTAPAQTWIDIGTGKLDGQQAVMRGDMKVDGELGLLMQMGRLFGGDNSGARESNLNNPGARGGNGKNAAHDEIASPEEQARHEKAASGLRGPLKIPGMLWLNVIFIPWMIKWIWGGFTTTAAPFAAAAVSAGIIFFYHLLTNRPTLFETGSVIYLILAAAMKIGGLSLYTQNTIFLDNLYLGALWLGSLMTTFTLTGEYSRHNLPPELWHSHAFLQTNRIICGVWGLYFLLCALFIFLARNGLGHELFWRIVGYILLVPMFVFTAVFQNRYPEKLMTQGSTARFHPEK
ncbi:MAG: NAD(P)H-dependent oxidoreductase [Spirochaetia bacterium]